MKPDGTTDSSVLTLSRGTSIILLILYVMYLVFQLRTHSELFDAETQAEDEEEETPVMGPWAAAGVLIITTLLVALCAEYLVDSIDAMVEKANVSKTFIGLILLPIVGNAAEHVTAVVVAVKGKLDLALSITAGSSLQVSLFRFLHLTNNETDKMDLALGVAIGSSMQIALLITPFLVILGWIIDQPMSLKFETFETVVFFLSVLVVTYVLNDGKSNYLEGAMVG